MCSICGGSWAGSQGHKWCVFEDFVLSLFYFILEGKVKHPPLIFTLSFPLLCVRCNPPLLTQTHVLTNVADFNLNAFLSACPHVIITLEVGVLTDGFIVAFQLFVVLKLQHSDLWIHILSSYSIVGSVLISILNQQTHGVIFEVRLCLITSDNSHWLDRKCLRRPGTRVLNVFIYLFNKVHLFMCSVWCP